MLAVRVWRRPTYPHYGTPVPPAIPDDPRGARPVTLRAGETKVVTAHFDVAGVPRWSPRSPVTHELVAELRVGAVLTDALRHGGGRG